MMMKTALTSSVLVALFAANAGAAANYVTTAATGSKATATVHFTGEIVASTCVVSTANQPGKTVALPQVTNQLFSGAGSSTGDTSFTLQFTNCQGSTGGSGYVVVFTGKTPSGKAALLEATRSSGAANDVGIEVDHEGHALDFASGKTEVPLTLGSNGDAQIDLVAKYQQIGATLPAAGTITADMNYTVIYK
ncbi:type 1 fimbrial protein [Citrobacter sp. Cb019]|uniref:fimbrial protein n=1 Tax=unclassified Citrobacter TaxID=2644389 RepID=UPI00257A5A27|nr:MULTISPECIES: fimbrial protein [unclassified Citrobacter]MDM3401170.1 type 1 fimbrial protein [Citrobacter sp. Cb019]MDM3423638.1 type 1 fimbrial protein [Citrobacter sp. Cb026]